MASAFQQESDVGGSQGSLRDFFVGVLVADLDGDVGGGEALRDGPAAGPGGGVVVGDLLFALEEGDLDGGAGGGPFRLGEGVEVAPAKDRVQGHGEQGGGLAGAGVAAQAEVHQAQGVAEGEIDDSAAGAAQSGLRRRVEQVRLLHGRVYAGKEDAVRGADAGFAAVRRCGKGEDTAVLGRPKDGGLRRPDARGAPADLRAGQEGLRRGNAFALGVVPDRHAEIDVCRVLSIQGSRLGGYVHHGVEDKRHVGCVPVRNPEGAPRHRETEKPCDQQSDMSCTSEHHAFALVPRRAVRPAWINRVKGVLL